MKKRYGLPFKGYMSSIPRHMVPDDYLADGYNLDYVAKDGSFRVRGGSIQEQAAMLEVAPATMQPRRVIEFKSDSLSDGEPTYGVLYGGSIGCFAFRNTGTAGNPTGSNETVGKDFSATQYPSDFKCVPLLANGAYTRCKTAAERSVIAKGSTNCIEVGDWMYFPSYSAVPHRWNKRFNGSTTLGSENVRIFPAGNIPPLSPPRVSSWPAAGTEGPWQGGTYFYVSQVYEYDDGSYSQPFIPRPVTTTLTGGLGLILVPGTSANYYPSVTMLVNAGPSNVRRIHLLATPAVVDRDTAKISDLQLWASIEQVPGVVDAVVGGFPVKLTDFSLLPDPRLIRFDRTWLPPTKFMWVGDQRVWSGCGNGYLGGIIVAPQINASDESATGFEVKVDGSNVSLYDTGTGDLDTVAIGGSKTLQEVCDEINTKVATSGYNYTAQLVPGTDGSAPSSYLLSTGSVDFGDTAAGRAQMISNAQPVVLWLNSTYNSGIPATRRRVYFTEGGPGLGGLSGANWIAGNYREVDTNLGDVMAGGNTPNGQVVVSARGVSVVKNTRDSRTGLDQDYYVHVINQRRGCISADSFIQGDGWVAYLTEDGFVACDGEREIIISGAVYNPATKTGDWAREIEACKNSARSGDDSSFFRASVVDGVIYVAFRGSNSQLADLIMKYDFSAGSSASGLLELLRPDGEPFGWSPPHRFEYSSTGVGVGPIGGVSKSTGTVILSASDSAATNGRVERLEQFDSADFGATQTISCTTNIDPGTEAVLITSGSFSRVPVGAAITGTGIAANTAVLSVDSLTELAMSNNATLAGTNTMTFTGRTVVAEGYCRTDPLGSARKKSVVKASPYYKKGARISYMNGFRMTVSRDVDRYSKRFVALDDVDGVGTPYGSMIKTMSPSIQTPAKSYEFGFDHDGSDVDVVLPSFWGIEIEYEEMNSNR